MRLKYLISFVKEGTWSESVEPFEQEVFSIEFKSPPTISKLKSDFKKKLDLELGVDKWHFTYFLS